jgi:hypothetical protein
MNYAAYRSLAGEQFFAEVARVSLGEDVGHLLVLAQLARRQELERTLVASEARVSAAMELGSVLRQPLLRAQISDRRAFEANIQLKCNATVNSEFLQR